MITKLTGVIIKENIVGEGDKYITLFTKEYGKVQVLAPKAKKHEQGMASGTQLFVYGKFIIRQYKSTYKLINVEIISMFHNIREDIIRLSYATYIAEVLGEVTREAEVNEELLNLSVAALHYLTKTASNPKLVRRVFELRMLKLIGLMPNVESCLQCDKSLEKEPKYYFDVEEGGVICEACRKYANNITLSYVVVYTMRYVLYMPIKQIFRFELEQYVFKKFEYIVDNYLLYHLEKDFKTKDFINQIENM